MNEMSEKILEESILKVSGFRLDTKMTDFRAWMQSIMTDIPGKRFFTKILRRRTSTRMTEISPEVICKEEGKSKG